MTVDLMTPEQTLVQEFAVVVENLGVALDDGTEIVGEINFGLLAGEVLGVVGESGSGKTTVGTALLGYARPGARIYSGRVLVGGVDVLGLAGAELQAVRGQRAAYVPQDPGSALDPGQRVGALLREVLVQHLPGIPNNEIESQIMKVIADVGLPAEPGFLRLFPHQLSGGQQQRVVIAAAFALRPTLVVLDEPTTALDVTTQARILETLRELCTRHRVAAVYVSHDLAVVKDIADRVLVLYAGRVVERAARSTLFVAPAHPYTQGLLAAIPDVAERTALAPIPGIAPVPGRRPSGCAFAPRCVLATDACRHETPAQVLVGSGQYAACVNLEVATLRPKTPVPLPAAVSAVAATPLLVVRGANAYYGATHVVRDVSLTVGVGECLAVVGESGSGKTTLARGLAGIGERFEAEVTLAGTPVPARARKRAPETRKSVQLVFQNPQRALNPRRTVGDTLRAVVRHFESIGRVEADRRVLAVLDRVALAPRVAGLRPRDLSGGERQRVAIARALLCEPALLICDEITSALDVSVQAAVLELLRGLQDDGLSLLFVTHDLGVVRAVADRVLVLRAGRVVEQGSVSDVLDNPRNSYTQTLIGDSPSLRRNDFRYRGEIA
ncbi:ABC transporter ATP-binding protein [Rhodococcus globerulus]|uniref:ABC transporter ATP-binding protein n=1 Tax=Rhodococcus globerulus TaxID=33008 RepID=A0ABU4C610_RHOGO|nr:ABC transporter ATP-binding protein [Rhodococcus globerulus]MDV6271719.1 ABC transporter ATP-binding protein [Rhodococcus globerulus]